jgi:hypothetical protein
MRDGPHRSLDSLFFKLLAPQLAAGGRKNEITFRATEFYHFATADVHKVSRSLGRAMLSVVLTDAWRQHAVGLPGRVATFLRHLDERCGDAHGPRVEAVLMRGIQTALEAVGAPPESTMALILHLVASVGPWIEPDGRDPCDMLVTMLSRVSCSRCRLPGRQCAQLAWHQRILVTAVNAASARETLGDGGGWDALQSAIEGNPSLINLMTQVNDHVDADSRARAVRFLTALPRRKRAASLVPPAVAE